MYKELNQAKKLLKQLEELEREVIQIEEYVIKIKDKKLIIKLDLSYDTPPQDEKLQFDEYGGIVIPGTRKPLGFISSLINDLSSYNPQPREAKESCNLSITEVMALQVLGIIIAHKESERMFIINQLRKLGFQTNTQ